MVENVTGIKSRITLTVDVTLKIKKKNIMWAKKVIFRILQHVASKIINMQEVLFVIQWFYKKKQKLLQQKVLLQKLF